MKIKMDSVKLSQLLLFLFFSCVLFTAGWETTTVAEV